VLDVSEVSVDKEGSYESNERWR